MNDNQDNTTVGTEPDMVNHPPHYTDGPSLGKLECLDITRMLPFDLGNAFKYVWRAGKKDPKKAVEDLQKAEFYLTDWWVTPKMLRVVLYPRETFLLARIMFSHVEKMPSVDLLERTRMAVLQAILDDQAEEACDLILRMRSLFDA